MKLSFIVFLLFSSILLFSQTNHIQNFNTFNSCFQKVGKRIYNGIADASLIIDFKAGNKTKVTFTKNPAILDIVPDTNMVYDVSFKN